MLIRGSAKILNKMLVFHYFEPAILCITQYILCSLVNKVSEGSPSEPKLLPVNRVCWLYTTSVCIFSYSPVRFWDLRLVITLHLIMAIAVMFSF